MSNSKSQGTHAISVSHINRMRIDTFTKCVRSEQHVTLFSSEMEYITTAPFTAFELEYRLPFCFLLFEHPIFRRWPKKSTDSRTAGPLQVAAGVRLGAGAQSRSNNH